MNDSHHPNDEVLVDVAMHLATAESTRVVMEHLRECPVCESRFRDLAAGWERAAVRVTGLSERSPTPREGIRARLRGVFSLPATRWAAAAAAVAVVAFAVFPRLSGPPQDLTRLPDLMPDVLQRATVSEPENRLLMQGINAYGRGDYEAAIAALSDVETTGPVDALRRVYLASAQAWSGRHEDAITTLDQVPLEVIPNPWSVEAKWTLYVSLAQTGQAESAQAVLEELAEVPGEPGERARARLGTDSGR